jgi:CheY-like chemotaxis protein
MAARLGLGTQGARKDNSTKVENTGAILVAEDNGDDVLLIRMAFQRAGLSNPIAIVSNGEEVVQYLQGEGIYSDREKYPLPSILLLDLKMPRMTGFEVLSWIKQQPAWRSLPVIVLTMSAYGPDVKQAYQLGANSFLTKPTEFNSFVETVKQMATFWLRGCTLPDPPQAKSLPPSPSQDKRV